MEHLLKKLLFFITAVSHAGKQQESLHDDLLSWSKTFAELMQVVEQTAYRQPAINEAMTRAMKGFISIDPHSSFLDSKAFETIMQMANGSFSGIGVILDTTRL